jgi:hypothetical protein
MTGLACRLRSADALINAIIKSLTQFERPGHRTLGLGDKLCFAPMDKESDGDDGDHGNNY